MRNVPWSLADIMDQHRTGDISSEQARKLLEEEAKKLRQGLKTGEEKLQKD